MRTTILFLFVTALSFVTACGNEPNAAPIRLATTTSTDNSGLLDFILPPSKRVKA